ncbi:MAG: hypothetical protein Q7R87_01010 [Nanoarchaeota archaeon]|nr:hypothetical protein [Nanoarchaeota archaeon]
MIRNYLRKNPKATFRELKNKTGTKVNRVYLGGMSEAYEDAGIPKPRTLKFKSPEEKRAIIIDYLRKHPTAGGQTISKDTKINFLTIFDNTEEMFREAGLDYPRSDLRKLKNRDREFKKYQILKLLREDPLISSNSIQSNLRIKPYSLFKNTKEMYLLAGIPFVSKGEKRRIKKQIKIIEYIKNNNFATQREINNYCNTRVQGMFTGGIFGAYKNAGVLFPFERLKIHGSAIKKIRDEAILFEKNIARKLSSYGAVNRLIRTKRGIPDIIMERKGRKVVVELKNYKSHEISISQIKQVNRYLEDIGSNLGFLICLKKPKKDIFLMEENKIFVIVESEISKIPEIIDKDL